MRGGHELQCRPVRMRSLLHTNEKILTLKSTLNFFKLSICFLWSGAIDGGPMGK